jgi:hypothetical protein
MYDHTAQLIIEDYAALLRYEGPGHEVQDKNNQNKSI